MKKEYTALYFELSSFDFKNIICISDTAEVEDDEVEEDDEN